MTTDTDTPTPPPLTPAEMRELRNFGGPPPADVATVRTAGTPRPGFKIPAPPTNIAETDAVEASS